MEAPVPPRLPISYVLPIRVEPTAPPDPDLDAYLHDLVEVVGDLVVVDGSPPARFEAHRRRWPAAVHHLEPDGRTANGKVAGVVTGVRAARQPVVVVADDDVRWDRALLERAIERLGDAQVVRPQNVFDPAPWHARWDAGRSLVHRALGGDWPGTLVFCRDAFPEEGYAGDVLFENLELVRAITAAGGTEVVALDLVVPRRPPTTRRFLEQRVRQAYDELARPRYLVAELAVLPLLLAGRRRAGAALAAGAVVLAEAGRRRAGGASAWGLLDALAAPLWLAERAVTSWIALAARCRGGISYRGTRLLLAATPARAADAGLRSARGGGGAGRPWACDVERPLRGAR